MSKGGNSNQIKSKRDLLILSYNKLVIHDGKLDPTSSNFRLSSSTKLSNVCSLRLLQKSHCNHRPNTSVLSKYPHRPPQQKSVLQNTVEAENDSSLYKVFDNLTFFMLSGRHLSF